MKLSSFFNHFRIQLLTTLLLVLFAFTAILSLSIWFKASEYLKHEIGTDLVYTNLLMTNKLDRYIWSRYAELSITSNLDILKAPTDPSQIEITLKNLQHFIPSFDWIGFINTRGEVIASTSQMPKDFKLTNYPYLHKAEFESYFGIIDSSPIINDGETSIKTFQSFLEIGRPVYNEDDIWIGVLVAQLSLDWLENIAQGLVAPLAEHRAIEMFVINPIHNRVILGPPGYSGYTLNLQTLSDLNGLKTSGYVIEQWPDGNQYLTSYNQSKGHATYPGLDWIILLRQNLDKAHKPTQYLLTIIWLIGGIFGACILVFAWIIASRVAKPIEQLTIAAEQMLKKQTNSIPTIRGYQEVKLLSQTLNRLVEQLTNAESVRDKMKELAMFDTLTGLANRRAMDEFVQTRKKQIQLNPSSNLTFLFLDLDRFKQVNDLYGHETGDKLLQAVSDRLKHVIKQNNDCMIVRLGGDEFVILLHADTINSKIVSQRIAERVINKLNEKFIIDHHPIQIGCSIGGAVWPNDHENLKDVMAMADKALYQAKEQGKNRAIFYSKN